MTTEPANRRGIGLTLLLGAIVVYDTLKAWSTVLAAGGGGGNPDAPAPPAWALGASVACSLARAAGALALLGGRRWGFFVVVAGAIAEVAFAFAVAGGFAAVYFAFLAFFVLAVLTGLLLKGGERSAWTRMR